MSPYLRGKPVPEAMARAVGGRRAISGGAGGGGGGGGGYQRPASAAVFQDYYSGGGGGGGAEEGILDDEGEEWRLAEEEEVWEGSRGDQGEAWNWIDEVSELSDDTVMPVMSLQETLHQISSIYTAKVGGRMSLSMIRLL